jgi:DeoR family glycerol-3-phosphate regulon repressor
MSTARWPNSRRLTLLAQKLRETGFVSVGRVAREFGVSEMTVRRDLARLEAQDVAVRTHGGAVAGPRTGASAVDVDEPSFATRARENAWAKDAIARAAAALPGPHQTVALDVGTTTLGVAHHLNDRRGLKIFTNNLRAALLLSDTPHTIYVPGGQIRPDEKSICGSMGVAQLRDFWFDHVFLGASGLTEDACYDYSLEETEVKTVYLERAANVVLLCDSSKFGRRSLVKVCDLERIDVLVTDAAPPPRLCDALERARVRVIVAELRDASP